MLTAAAKAKTTRSKKSTRLSNSLSTAVNLEPEMMEVTGAAGGSSSTTTGTIPTNSGTPGNRTVLVGDQFQLLTKLEADSVAKWATKVKNLISTGASNTALSMVSEELYRDIEQKAAVLEKDSAKAKSWKTWPCKDLIAFLERAYPQTGSRHETVEEQMKANVTFTGYRPNSIATMDKIQNAINGVVNKNTSVLLDAPANKAVTSLLYRSLKNQNTPLYDSMAKGGLSEDIDSFINKLLTTAESNAAAVLLLKPYGYRWGSSQPAADSQGGHKRKREGDSTSEEGHKHLRKDRATNKKPSVPTCNHCGWRNHKTSECKHTKRNDPDINPNANTSWVNSAQGKAWKLIDKDRFDFKYENRPLDRKFYDIKGMEFLSCMCHDCVPPNTNPISENATHSQPIEEVDTNPPIFNTIEGQELLSAFNSTDDYTIPGHALTVKDDLPIRFLLYIGALQGNYISLDLAKALEAKGIPRSQCNHRVCSAMSEMCKQAQGKMSFYVQYYNVYEQRVERMHIVAKVLDIQFDLIIGLPTIKSCNLITEKFAYLFSSGSIPVYANLDSPVEPAGRTHTTHPNAVLAGLMRSADLDSMNLPTRVGKLDLLQQTDPDSEELEDAFTQEPWNETPLPEESDVLDLVYIEGDDITRARIREFLSQFRDLFSKQLRPEPANVPPMQLTVDVERWENDPANHRPPRIQSALRQEETRRQVNDMLAHNVIRPTDSAITSYSQVLLTPKPNKQYRFCIDFRNLNLVTKAPVWPIPLIQATIERLGSKRPKYFAVIDLTKGYYQAPLAESSRHFTAFITLMGLYEWTRVPMGLKGAPAYFQRVMATVVFAGLLYNILEIYLDDVITHNP